MSGQSWDFVRHEQILVSQCLMANCLCEEQHRENKLSCKITILQQRLKPRIINAESEVH